MNKICQAIAAVWILISLISCSDNPGPVADDIRMLKLYKNVGGQLYYQEAWEADEGITYHHGKVGENGTTETVFAIAIKGESPVRAVLKNALSNGYKEIPLEQHSEIVVQYKIDGWGESTDLDKRYKIEGLLGESLGWSGLGHVDGGDTGSGSVNIFAYVVDVDIAVKFIVGTLETNGVLEGAVIAVQDLDRYEVRYPSDFEGEFWPL